MTVNSTTKEVTFEEKITPKIAEQQWRWENQSDAFGWKRIKNTKYNKFLTAKLGSGNGLLTIEEKGM